MNAALSPQNTAVSCPATSWSGQSAFYFLLSLALGCISHPRGSLIFNRSSRVWRLSPIFLLIENGEIAFRILECVRAQGWKWRAKAVRVHVYAILALREGNAWSQAEYDAFFQEAENERFLGDEEDGEVDEGEGIRIRDLEHSALTVTRRGTAPREEVHDESIECYVRSLVGDPITISLRDWFTTENWVSYRNVDRPLTPEERQSLFEEIKRIKDRKVRKLLDARFRKNLEQVQDYEKGPSFRISLWFPMVQQLAKATLVSGARLTISVGMVYLVSFLVIEACLLAVRTPLEEEDRAKAMKLLRRWGPMKRADPKDGKGTQLEPMPRNPSLVWIIAASVMNFCLFCSILNLSPFRPFLGILHLALRNIIELWKEPWYRMPLLLALNVLKIYIYGGYLLFYAMNLCSITMVPLWLSMLFANWARDYQKYFSKPMDGQECQELQFMSATTALITVLLAIVVYFGLGVSGGLSYDCSTTAQKPFYDLLG